MKKWSDNNNTLIFLIFFSHQIGHVGRGGQG